MIARIANTQTDALLSDAVLTAKRVILCLLLTAASQFDLSLLSSGLQYTRTLVDHGVRLWNGQSTSQPDVF